MQESIQLVIDSLPFLLKGAGYTLQLSIGGMFFGLLLGFILALMRLSPIWPVRWLARFYISIFRGTPLIAQLFMIYLKWFTEFGHLNRGDMLTSEQHRCHNEKKKFQRRV